MPKGDCDRMFLVIGLVLLNLIFHTIRSLSEYHFSVLNAVIAVATLVASVLIVISLIADALSEKDKELW